jgi:hypothetical protein
LCHESGGCSHAIGKSPCILSKSLGAKNLPLSIYEKECLAIILAFEKWNTYLQHSKFTIHTNKSSPIHFDEDKFNNPTRHKEFFKLMELQYKILYKKGQQTKQQMHYLGDHTTSVCALFVSEAEEEMGMESELKRKEAKFNKENADTNLYAMEEVDVAKL